MSLMSVASPQLHTPFSQGFFPSGNRSASSTLRTARLVRILPKNIRTINGELAVDGSQCEERGEHLERPPESE